MGTALSLARYPVYAFAATCVCGDALPRDYESPRGFSLVVGVANADEADRVFAGLAEGGEVIMPLQATHWSPRYGLVRDPFGIRWEINCDAEPAA